MAKKKDTIDIIIETPKGCRNKYTYDENLKAFKLKKFLPAGAVFPFDFGFIPNTKGGDGDPWTCWLSWMNRHTLVVLLNAGLLAH